MLSIFKQYKWIFILILIGVFLAGVYSAFKWYTDKIFQSGVDACKAEQSEKTEELKKKLNDQFDQRLKDAISESERKRKEALKFIKELQENAKPTVTDEEINQSELGCDYLSPDFGRLFNKSIGEPIYRGTDN